MNHDYQQLDPYQIGELTENLGSDDTDFATIQREVIEDRRALRVLYRHFPRMTLAIVDVAISEVTLAPQCDQRELAAKIRHRCRPLKTLEPKGFLLFAVLGDIIYQVIVLAVSQILVEQIMKWWHRRHPDPGPTGPGMEEVSVSAEKVLYQWRMAAEKHLAGPEVGYAL